MSYTHLHQKIGDIVFDRLLSQEEVVSDFPVRFTLGNLLENDPLAVG